MYARPNDRQISIRKKASGKHRGMQKRARDNRTKDVLSLIDKRESAVDRVHILITHIFNLLLIHAEFPCACSHKIEGEIQQR